MSMDSLIKYSIWIAVFVVASVALTKLFGGLGL